MAANNRGNNDSSGLVCGGILAAMGNGAGIAQTPISPPFPPSHGVDGVKLSQSRAQVVIGESLELRATVQLSSDLSGAVRWTARHLRDGAEARVRSMIIGTV